ncbi:MAG: HD domain-containing protein [Kofleriaceae bacterium]|nr:HD domain-containing protein [Kofleriaceae bacterium]
MSRRFRALVAHPDSDALSELAGMLSVLGLTVDTATTEQQALQRLHKNSAHVIVAGHAPPLLDAVRLLEASIASAPEALRIALVSDPADAVELDYRPVQAGTIMRLVAHAHERSRLIALVGEGIKLLTLVEQQRELVRKITAEHQKLQRRETLLDVVVRERTKELEESYLQLKAANRQALFGLAEAIEAKDPYTKGHCGRVAGYALVLAQAAGYPADGLETLEFGAFLHDIGKIGIRDAVLLKPAALDDTEWTHMREHPVKGYEIASKIEMLRPIISAVRNHHERWDGAGYPDRLAGQHIPVAARIVAIADAYDAMATDRPYKAALPAAECEEVLRQQAERMFDPELVEVFIRNDIGALYRDEYGSYDEPDDTAVTDGGGRVAGL